MSPQQINPCQPLSQADVLARLQQAVNQNPLCTRDSILASVVARNLRPVLLNAKLMCDQGCNPLAVLFAGIIAAEISVLQPAVNPPQSPPGDTGTQEVR